MPKTVFILRHGKSDWDTSCMDHERPLARRGHRAARLIGTTLAAAGQVPDRVVSSTANRASTTAQTAIESGSWSCTFQEIGLLYGVTAGQMLDIVKGTSEDLASVMLVGHEPSCSSFLGQMVGQARIRYPTAAVARVDFPVVAWSQLRFGGGELRWFMTPRVLESLQQKKQ